MAQHISRRELKKDEVRDTLAHGVEEVLSHQRAILYIIVIAAVVGLAAFGWKYYSDQQTARAQAEFNDAMMSFQADVQSPGAPPRAGMSYSDDKSKWQDAAKKFGLVAMDYPRTRPGQLAHYYAALSLEKLGDDNDARKWLEGIENSSTQEFAAMAKFELAKIDDHTGDSADAVKLYKELIAKPSILVPKPVVMLALAQHYGTSNPVEATKLYDQIKSEYPDTAIAQQADQERSLLPGKS